jgi:flagellar biogenesis protein FliO
MDLLDGLLKTGSALAIVLALVVLAALGARRWLAPVLGAAGARRPVRLVDSLALGGRRNVLVLDVQGRTLVVGATPQALTLLTQFEKEGAASGAHAEESGAMLGRDLR